MEKEIVLLLKVLAIEGAFICGYILVRIAMEKEIREIVSGNYDPDMEVLNTDQIVAGIIQLFRKRDEELVGKIERAKLGCCDTRSADSFNNGIDRAISIIRAQTGK